MVREMRPSTILGLRLKGWQGGGVQATHAGRMGTARGASKGFL